MKEGKKRGRGWGEGPAVQLNCYDIIRGDPSGTGRVVVLLLEVVMSMVVPVVKTKSEKSSGSGKGEEGER